MRNHKRPPIGILSRIYFEKFLEEDIILNGGMCLRDIKIKRLSNLKRVIRRYVKANIHLDIEWILEYNKILDEFNN